MQTKVKVWSELASERRKKVLKALARNFDVDEEFRRSQVNSRLDLDKNVSKKLLDGLTDDGYLVQTKDANNVPVLYAVDTDTGEFMESLGTMAVGSNQEDLARKAAVAEDLIGLIEMIENTRWNYHPDRKSSVDKFNQMANGIELIPTFTADKYKLTPKGLVRIRKYL